METQLPLSPWPPQFTLKKSGRVRHVQLKASVRYGLELIVPLRFNQKHIPEILETHKPWIQKQLEKIKIEIQALQEKDLPTEINLASLNQIWKIDYINCDNKKLRLQIRHQLNELVLLGNTQDKAACKKMLANWVRKQAQKYLPQRLQMLSQQTKLTYRDVSIRGQRSRWGSCSTDKSLNLNFKLLFLPTHLVDHIIIHELCHTVHMNHSTKFWRLVASLDQNWKQHSHESKLGDKFVPMWVE